MKSGKLSHHNFSLSLILALCPLSYANTLLAAEALVELAPEVPKAATFSLRPTAEVQERIIALSDVASCTGDADICDEAYAVELGSSPEASHSATWSQEKIKAVLVKEWPGAEFTMAGAKSVRVSTFGVLVDEKRVEESLAQLFATHFSGDESLQVSLARLNLTSNLHVRSPAYTIEFPELNEEHLSDSKWVLAHLHGQVRIQCSLAIPGDEPRSDAILFYASTQINLREKRLVTNKELRQGTVVQGQDLIEAWQPSSRAASVYLTDSAEVIGHTLKRQLPAGSPLHAGDLANKTVIKRGQVVTMTLSGTGVDVTSQVKLLEDAVMGQVAQAMIPATKKIVKVRALNAETVQVVL